MLPPLAPPPDRAPNRLDLARWLFEPANPLTARVMVNRVWQQYFGRGLVETENDFGTQGLAPTHPELLDWLAVEFVARKWSLKAMHRLIVTSSTYRQSSHARPDLEIIDPHNKLLARQPRLRLDAEIVRDVALTASGLLSPKLGGPPVFPPHPRRRHDARPGEARLDREHGRRPLSPRPLHAFWRATPHPALAVFDAPDGFSTCTRRLRTNTPLQALTLAQRPAFFEFAQRPRRRASSARAAPTRRAASTTPSASACPVRPRPTSRAASAELLAQIQPSASAREAWTTVARVLLNLDETITRE